MRVNLERFIKKHGSTVLTYTSVVGVIGTAVMTSKATTKANIVLEKAKKDKGDDLTLLEKINYSLPSYIPTIIIGIGTIACIFSANILNKKHQASLMSAYAVLDQSYKEYRNKVTELYGEEASNDIEESIANEHILKNDDLQLFYDEYSKRYFESTLYKVQRAEYELNRNMLKRDYVYLNEWYEELDIDTIDHGYDLGWTTFQCMEMYWQPWIDFDHYKFITNEGKECTGICIVEQPILDFEDYC